MHGGPRQAAVPELRAAAAHVDPQIKKKAAHSSSSKFCVGPRTAAAPRTMRPRTGEERWDLVLVEVVSSLGTRGEITQNINKNGKRICFELKSSPSHAIENVFVSEFFAVGPDSWANRTS